MCGPPHSPARGPHCAGLCSRRPGGQAPCSQWAPFPPPHACCSFPVAYSDVPSSSSFRASLATGLAILPGLVRFSSRDQHDLVWQPPPTCSRPMDSPATQSWHSPGSSQLSHLAFQRLSYRKQKTQGQDPLSCFTGAALPFSVPTRQTGHVGMNFNVLAKHQYVF